MHKGEKLEVYQSSQELATCLNKTTLLGRAEPLSKSKANPKFFSIDQFAMKLYLFKSVEATKIDKKYDLSSAKFAEMEA